MKKGIRITIILILSMITIVFLILGLKEKIYSIDTKYKNEAIREISIKESNDPIDRKIDFEKLKAINNDVVAWIYIPGTNIDYPILVGDSNEEYLYKDIEGKYNPLGSLFSFTGTNFTKGNTFIFGHNMANEQMFGQLKSYISSEFSNEHKYFYLYTERKAMKCDIFSTFICNMNDSILRSQYELGTVDYLNFLSEITTKNNFSEYNLDGEIMRYSTTKTFSLITCYGAEGTKDRLVVNGIVIEEKIR